MVEQLQIRFLFKDALDAEIEDKWDDWISINATSRDDHFIKVVIHDKNIMYHAVDTVASFNTRIINV